MHPVTARMCLHGTPGLRTCICPPCRREAVAIEEDRQINHAHSCDARRWLVRTEVTGKTQSMTPDGVLHRERLNGLCQCAYDAVVHRNARVRGETWSS